MKWQVPLVTTLERMSITPDIGELLYDEDTQTYWGGDNITVGGIEFATTNDIPDLTNYFDKTTDDADDITEGVINKFNQTHTGEVTGSVGLTLNKTAISNKTAVTPATNDYILIGDTSDSNNLKKVLLSALLALVSEPWTENPIGAINDINMSFSLTFNYISGSLKVYYNGLRQDSSFITETGANTFDLSFAPLTGENLIVDYIKA
jgi:hypothetical protein